MQKLANISNFENLQNQANGSMNAISDMSVFNREIFFDDKFHITIQAMTDEANRLYENRFDNAECQNKLDQMWRQIDRILNANGFCMSSKDYWK